QAMPTPSPVRTRLSRSVSSLADADATLWFKLVNGPAVGMANLQAVFGSDIGSLVRDWSVSNAIDDVAQLTTQFQQRSWNWHSIYQLLGGTVSPYPLQITSLSNFATLSNVSVVAGGAAYYRISVAANAQVNVNITSGANPNLQVIVVRTR